MEILTDITVTSLSQCGIKAKHDVRSLHSAFDGMDSMLQCCEALRLYWGYQSIFIPSPPVPYHHTDKMPHIFIGSAGCGTFIKSGCACEESIS